MFVVFTRRKLQPLVARAAKAATVSGTKISHAMPSFRGGMEAMEDPQLHTYRFSIARHWLG